MYQQCLLRWSSQSPLLVRFTTNHHFTFAVTTESQQSSNLLLNEPRRSCEGGQGWQPLWLWVCQAPQEFQHGSMTPMQTAATPHCPTACAVLESFAETREPIQFPGTLCPNLALDGTSHPLLSCRTPTTALPTPCSKLEQVAQHRVHSGLEYLQGQRLQQHDNF